MANERDIPRLLDLLHQVLELHACGRPDIFVSGTTKYGHEELLAILHNPDTPVLVLCDDADNVQGYAMCEIQNSQGANMTDIRTLYLDDLCVDENCRGQQYGRKLYEAVREYGRSVGAYHVTLNVWSCNPSARQFYEAMGLKPMKTTMEDILQS